MPEGADVSEHNGELAPEWFAHLDFVIIRVFNENGVGDARFAENWRNAAGQCARGAYGWPTPYVVGDDYHLGQVLVHVAADAELGYWADRESVRGRAASLEDLEQFCKGIEAAGGRAGHYSNIGELLRSDYLDALPWWMADYGPNDGQRHDPNAQPPIPPADRPWQLHQYSSAGGLDRDWCDDDTFARLKGDDVAQPRCLLITKKGEPQFVWVLTDAGVKYPTTNRRHAELMKFFGLTPNGPDDPTELDADAFDAFPSVAGGTSSTTPAPPMPLELRLTGTATPTH